METLQGLVRGPELPLSFTGATYTCSHGVSPGVVTLTVPDAGTGDPLDVVGVKDITLTDGTADFTLRGCRAQDATLVAGGDGRAWRVNWTDRRWAWAYRLISGAYNRRDPWVTSGARKIVPATRVDVHTLARLCLEAMGEAEGSWDISTLPDPDEDELLPEVQWDDMPAAEALAELVERFGCRVVYQPIRDRVLVAKAGEGADLPAGSFTRKAPAKQQPARPEKLTVVGAPAAFPAALVLEAVGQDLDGSVVPIRDLTYAPPGGWQYSLPPHFPGIQLPAKWAAKGKTLSDVKNLAGKSVFRWYRVTLAPLPGGEFKVPGLDQFRQWDGKPVEVIDRDQIIPLERIYGADRDEDRQLYVSPAKCYGIYESRLKANNTDPQEPVKVGFTIDSAHGLVMFETYVYRVNPAAHVLQPLIATAPALAPLFAVVPQGVGPAELVLVCSVWVLDLKTRTPIPYRRDRVIGGGQPGLVKPVRRSDVQFATFAEYDPTTKRHLPAKDNRAECDAAADTYLRLLDDFGDRVAETRTYPRLVAVDPDGAIEQVTWDCAGAVSTTVSRNTEHTVWLPPYLFRRGRERAKVLQDQLGALGALGAGLGGQLPAAIRSGHGVPGAPVG